MRNSPSIRKRLAALVLASGLPAALLMLGIVVHNYVSDVDKVRQSTIAATRAIAISLDQRLDKVRTGLLVLASSRMLWRDNLAAFDLQAREVHQTLDVTSIFLVDAGDHQRVNTRRPTSQLTPQTTVAPQTLEVFKTGQPLVTDLFHGAMTGNVLVVISVPVIHAGKVVYSLNAGITPQKLQALVLLQQLPADWVVSILDRSGTMVTRSQDLASVGRKAPAAVLQSISRVPHGVVEDEMTLTGVSSMFVHSRAAVSGWTVVAAVPDESLTGELKRSLAWLLGAILLIALLSLALVRYFSRGIARSMDDLALGAAQLGRGEAVAMRPAAFREAARLRHAIVQASVDLRAAQSGRLQNEVRLAGLIESAMDAIITLDQNQNVVLFNRAAELIFGWSRGEMVGRPLTELIPQRYQADHSAQVKNFGQQGASTRRMAPGSVVYGVRANGEEFPMDASISQLDTQQGKLYTVILRDVSQRVRAQQELAVLATEASAVREQEKARIARELHDDLAQALTALMMDTVWLRDQLPGATAPVAHKLAQMLCTMDAGVASTRRIAADLRPLLLDDLGLQAAIEWLADAFTQRHGVACELAIDGAMDLKEPSATAVFRIVQESLVNVAKHAQASLVQVEICHTQEGLLLRIRDDGAGFDMALPRKTHSLGLAGLRERAQLLKGTVRVSSAKGQGTLVEVNIPLASSSLDANAAA